MLTKSSTNFLPAYNNPHNIGLANRISNNIDIQSPFITKAHNELLSGGLQGLSSSLDPMTLTLIAILGGVWYLHGKGLKSILKG